ncbi:MAG: hypothetical protein V4568_09710 [Pseudomonadota bacterium]
MTSNPMVKEGARIIKAPLSSLAILPLIFGPVEANLPPAENVQIVSTIIKIQASPVEVFDQLA